MPYFFREFHIRNQMLESLQRYLCDGIAPGSFLTAVIQNNLSQACSRADDENLHNLPAFAAFLYNEAPSRAWGSKEKMDTWIKERQGNL